MPAAHTQQAFFCTSDTSFPYAENLRHTEDLWVTVLFFLIPCFSILLGIRRDQAQQDQNDKGD